MSSSRSKRAVSADASVKRSLASRFLSHWPAVVAGLALLGLWQLFVVLDLGRVRLPGPVEVWESFVTMVSSATFWEAAADSAQVFLQGLLLGAVLGVLIGVVVGSIRWLDFGVGPLLYAAYATPFIALIPLFVVVFGFGVGGKTSIIFFLVFVTVALQTIEGVRQIDPVFREVAMVFQTPARRRWLEINLPASLPYVIVGLRLGIGRGLVGVIVAEFYTSVTGLGGLILREAQRVELANALVPPLFLAAIGIMLNSALRRREAKLNLWRS